VGASTGRKPRLAVLVSGRGSNLQAVLDAIACGGLDAEVVGVFSDRPDAAALERVPAALRWSARSRDFTDREAFDAALAQAVDAVAPDWVFCAGYMRILGHAFVQRFDGRLLNVHPSLLPCHKGLRTHARALEAGDAEHGASVHFVVPELDAGAVVAQVRIQMLPADTAESLAARLLPLEHRLVVATLALATAGRLAEHGGQVQLNGQTLFTPLQLDSTGNLRPGSQR
jgi:phosphoribosylglycinamide formyltransferase-1